jgi:hypothetical protein
MTTVHVGVGAQEMEAYALEKTGENADLIKLSEDADECIIGCYLHSPCSSSSPGWPRSRCARRI